MNTQKRATAFRWTLSSNEQVTLTIFHPLLIHCSYQWLIHPTAKSAEGHLQEGFANIPQIFLPDSSPSFPTPSSAGSASATAGGTAAADTNGSPTLGDIPSISFPAGSETVWAFSLCKRSHVMQCLFIRSTFKA